MTEYVAHFDQLPSALLREKPYDIIDVGRRLLENLTGIHRTEDLYAGKILIARKLLPYDALKLSSQGALGVVLLNGGVTSHVAFWQGHWIFRIRPANTLPLPDFRIIFRSN